MDGLLIVDKPSGPTSHDLVARARRILRERRIGHTGTLDPMASGVLPLVIGRATRLARFLPGDKTYDAEVRLGFATDTCDALGEPTTAPFTGALPEAADIDAALEPFRGTFLQKPPVFSAKKIGGERSYAIARRAARAGEPNAASAAVALDAALPKAVPVTAYSVQVLTIAGDRVTLRIRCSAGFYVRALADDLGVALGTGAHLAGLRRLEAAGAQLDQAIPLAVLDSPDGVERAAAALIPIEGMLTALPNVILTDDGVTQVRFGRDVGPSDAATGFEEALSTASGASPIRLTSASGQLVAMATAAGALLHPSVVLM
jgi:tRNA pseudouridine55 synthase